jgi:hypothetical protein
VGRHCSALLTYSACVACSELPKVAEQTDNVLTAPSKLTWLSTALLEIVVNHDVSLSLVRWCFCRCCCCCSSLAGALPAALSRVAPNLLTPAAAQRAGSSSATAASSQINPAVAALRVQLGLPAVPQQPPVAAPAGASTSAAAVAASASAAAAAPCMAPGVVLQELARLGQQLLGDDGSTGGSTDGGGSFTSSSSIPPDVLVSAARQHLMSSAVAQLHVAQVGVRLHERLRLVAF